MKINTTEKNGKDGINGLLEITNRKETQQEKNKRIDDEIIKGVFD